MVQQPLVIIPSHSRQRLRQRGDGYTVADLRERVVRACQLPEVVGNKRKRLALVGDAVVPVVEVRQRTYGTRAVTRAVVVTVLGPGQKPGPGTILVNV